MDQNGEKSQPRAGSVGIDTVLLVRHLATLGWTSETLAEKVGVVPRTIERILQTGRASREDYACILEAVQVNLKEHNQNVGFAD